MANRIDPVVFRQQLDDVAKALRALESKVDQIAQSLPQLETLTPLALVERIDPTLLGEAAGGRLSLTENQHRICERVINVFETGTVNGKYGALSIYDDGPDRIRQITYGRSQTTEYGNLRELVQDYVTARGAYSSALEPYVVVIGTKVGSPPHSPLVDDARFKELLRKAGDDPVMRQTQDVFFDRVYFQPALEWAERNGFTRALSALVIYDSFIHSGGILPFLRQRFPEKTPANGGNEQTWITQYIDVRRDWLATHSNPDVRASVYRANDLKREIARGNWDLGILPINANGVPVDDGVDVVERIVAVPPALLALKDVALASAFVGELEEDRELGCEADVNVAALIERVATVTPAEPKAVPADAPVEFAQSRTNVSSRHWPVLTSHPLRNTVSYETSGGQIVGPEGNLRYFLARRSGGARLHAAVDLFAYEGDVVVASEDGKIVAFYPFYPARSGEMTYALFVEHADFVVNYGEVKEAAPTEFGWRAGDSVAIGQKIARVSATSMLHFECYRPGARGNERWMRNGPRPRNLLNPTRYLLELASQ